MTKIYGHRGTPVIAPENTIVGFQNAIDLGVDGIELDIHLTSDNQLVVIHDETLDRTTDGKGMIKDKTYNELKHLDAGSWFSPEFSKCRIPLLEEVLTLVEPTALDVNVEIKCGGLLYPGIESKVIDMVKAMKMNDRVIFSSFDHYSLIALKKIDASVKTGILYMASMADPWLYARHLGADALHPYYHGLTPELIEGIKASGLQLNTFTVDDAKDIKRLIISGVDGIITNHPKLALDVRKETL